MTDRELLELAAKAAGIAIEWHCWPSTSKPRAFVKNGLVAEIGGDCYDEWNPLNDDGDALRLAVKLRLHIQPDDSHVWATTVKETAIKRLGDDPLAATRRAIVRAAASIGEAMQ